MTGKSVYNVDCYHTFTAGRITHRTIIYSDNNEDIVYTIIIIIFFFLLRFRTYLTVPRDGGLSGADDDDELVASMRASRHTRTESATLATHYAVVAVAVQYNGTPPVLWSRA